MGGGRREPFAPHPSVPGPKSLAERSCSAHSAPCAPLNSQGLLHTPAPRNLPQTPGWPADLWSRSAKTAPQAHPCPTAPHEVNNSNAIKRKSSSEAPSAASRAKGATPGSGRAKGPRTPRCDWLISHFSLKPPKAARQCVEGPGEARRPQTLMAKSSLVGPGSEAPSLAIPAGTLNPTSVSR